VDTSPRRHHPIPPRIKQMPSIIIKPPGANDFAHRGRAGFDAGSFFCQRADSMKSVKVPAFEHFLHEMIPLAKAMGVGVEVSNDQALTLIAPKEQNRNSLNTAFGGSLVSLATLAGYGVVWELMKNEDNPEKPQWSIVVKESKAAYRRPVLGDLRAICERPAQAAIAEFKDALSRYGKAKLKLRTRVIEDGETAVDVTAAFVVSR
jgi:thioesterase domain-containing protein